MYVDTQSVYAFSQFFVFNMKFSRKIPLLACRPSPKSKYTYTRLFSPQRPRKRCSRRKTTHTTAALWGNAVCRTHLFTVSVSKKSALVRALDRDILWKAIDGLRKRKTAGAAIREIESKKITFKQTRQFQVKMFLWPRNGTTR